VKIHFETPEFLTYEIPTVIINRSNLGLEINPGLARNNVVITETLVPEEAG
jgi:hypothetical protein